MTLLQDLHFAVRSFRKSPVFTTVAVLSLALGIGANTAIFTLVDQLILRLLPVHDPDRIVLLAGRGRHYGGNSGIMCRYSLGLVVASDSQTDMVGGELVSGNYFPLLGIRPAVGRLFTSNDDLRTGEHPYAVISYGWWQSRFNGDPSVIGRSIRV